MRSLQLLIAASLGAVLALVVVERKQHADPPAAVVIVAGVRQDVIDYRCYSCGSGNGPSQWELAGLLHIEHGEVIVRDDTADGHQFHGQFHDYLIASPRGVRRAVVLLH